MYILIIYMYMCTHVHVHVLHTLTNIHDTCTCTYRSLLTHIEDGEELPAVVDVGGALVVKEKPKQQQHVSIMWEGHVSITWEGHVSITWEGHASITWEGHASITWEVHVSIMWEGHASITWEGHVSIMSSTRASLHSLEERVVHLSVHYHGLKHWPLSDDKLDHSVDDSQQLKISGNHYLHQRQEQHLWGMHAQYYGF